ncbi:flagellar export protein FliJ [Petropleomorpha daqingensis]|uniref:Flagellar export protein FliJ n=1 Tax=Petropleomorpha daqingensis TaxID=2026353 RepID=A0A853CGM5_9ACTN|nr:flagellar export protein FliJ [Petropleomorpha daqingensis]NYJ06331.1 flagellar export protein FliJ [Petropleomorpha daqingensis]
MGKRAAFRLQPVLELRRTQERAAAQAAAQAANAAAEADRHATERETALVGAHPPVSSTAGAFRASMALLRVAAEDAAAQRSLATASAEQAELVRQQWTAAAQRTKALERLKDRHAEAIRLADQAAEERAVDDLVTGRAGRPRAGSAAEEMPWTG